MSTNKREMSPTMNHMQFCYCHYVYMLLQVFNSSKTLNTTMKYYYKAFVGVGNSIMVTVFFCQAGHPGLNPAQSDCFRKVDIYQHVIILFPPVLTTSSTKADHV